MEVNLYQRRYSSYMRPYWAKTDYTGRWKIVVTNGEPTLYLECFSLHKYKKKEKVVLRRKGYIKDCQFLMFKWKEEVPEQKAETVQEVTKIRAKVEWVPEENLYLLQTEEYTNECGCPEV